MQRLLASPWPADWILAAHRLGMKGDVQELVRLLHADPRKAVRTAAAVVLAGFQGEAVVEALSRSLKDPEDWVRLAVVHALSFIGGKEVEGSIRQALRDKDADVAKAAGEALVRLKPGKPVSFSTIDQGSYSRFNEPAYLDFRAEEDWKRFWAKHRPQDSPPPVDFSQEMVIAVFLGPRPTAGFSIRVQRLEEKDSFLWVLIQETLPSQDTTALQAETLPYHIVKLPRKEIPMHPVRKYPPEVRSPGGEKLPGQKIP